MKNILKIFFFFIILISCRSTKTIDKKSIITKNIYFDTTWTSSDGPIIITGNLWIARPATLKIEKGTVIHFNDNAYITAEGSIRATGTKQNPIIFSSKNHNADHQSWEHVFIKRNSNKSLFDSVIFRNSRAALFIENDNVEIINCMFENNKHGVYINKASPSISQSLFQNNMTAIVSYGKNEGIISRNSFENNKMTAINGNDAFIPEISQNVFLQNNYGIFLKFNPKTENQKLPTIEFNDFANNKLDIFIDGFPSNLTLNATSNYFKNSAKLKGSINVFPEIKNPQFMLITE